MLEGLEVSELLFSKIAFENKVYRVDAEYFQRKYLIEDEQRKKFFTMYLGEESFITDGQHGYHEVDETSKIRHLTAKNFKNWFADDIGADRLAKWVDDNNQRSSLKVNDIILTTRGSVGYCAIVKENVLPANIDQDVARIAITSSERINPQYLVTFLNSKFGQDWLIRNQTGMVQQGLALWRVRELPIPFMTNNFQNKIAEIVEKSYTLTLISKQTYLQAENLLLESLGLIDFQPDPNNINVKSFQDSFLNTGRLDAEYYQPKYEDYLHHIKSLAHTTISNEFLQVTLQKNKIKDGYFYIEIGDVSVSDGTYTSNFVYTDNLPANAKIFVQRDDLLISKVRPYRGAVSIIEKDDTDLIVSGAFTVLRKKSQSNYNIEVLKVLLRTKIYKDWLLQFNVGTSYPVIKDEDVLQMPIPLIDLETQKKIAVLVQQSFALKQQSEQLLKVAKCAVEIAFEKDEEAAIHYINENQIDD